MAFLTLNGITIDCIATRGKEQWDVIGDKARAPDGSYRETRTAEKRWWEFETKLLVQETAEAVKRFILGQGYHWTWDADLYSDGKGLINSAGTGTPAVASGKFSNKLQVTSAQQLTYPCGLATKWLIMGWRLDGTWKHYAFNSDGDKWEDGTTFGGSIDWFSESSGDVLVGDASNAYDLDDLVVLPFLPPDAWIEDVWGAQTAAFSNLPHLTMDGDACDNIAATVVGSIVSTKFEGFSNSGTWEVGGQRVRFRLTEV